jgi:glycosyltransferase involved in cell wall biosynthesis
MFTAMKLLAEKLHLTCVTFVPFVPLEQLPQMMTEADLCLGIFGTTDKAGRVIPHKVYDAVAMGIPVITRDSVGIREKFARDPLVALVPAGDPVTLASSILQVREKIINKK